MSKIQEKDDFGNRMKSYEDQNRLFVDTQLPVIIRLDGSHFSTYVRGCKKPYDDNLIRVMNETAKYLCANVHGARMAYIQSDEISILLNSYTHANTQCWFNGNIQKMASVSAGMASAVFSNLSPEIFGTYKMATFDSRVFNVPLHEVSNVFLWRQQDAMRNSVSSYARTYFSDKEMFGKSTSQLKQMVIDKGFPWEGINHEYKMGRVVLKENTEKEFINPITKEAITAIRGDWVVDNKIPLFSADRDYIERFSCKREDDATT